MIIIKFRTQTYFTREHVVSGTDENGNFGTKIVTHDLNNDGYSDIIVSSPMSNNQK